MLCLLRELIHFLLAGEDGQNRLIAQLEAHLEGLRGSRQGAWLHRQALCALACLVTACALRPGVELKQAVSVVERGLAHVYKGLDAEGVDLKVCSRESNRPHDLLCLARWYC